MGRKLGELGPHLGQRRLGRMATIDMGRKLGGGCAFFLRGSGSPSNTVAWAEAYLNAKWHLSPSSRLATTDTGRKLGVFLLGGGEAGSPSNTMSPRLKWYPDAYSRLATINMGRKLGAVPPFGGCAPILLGEVSWVPI